MSEHKKFIYNNRTKDHRWSRYKFFNSGWNVNAFN